METTSPLHPIRLQTSDGEVYLVDWRDVDEVFRRDPEARTLPGDGDELFLTAEDAVWLWGMGIGF